MFQKGVGQVFVILGNEIGAIVFDVGRDSLSVIAAIRSLSCDNCLYAWIGNIFTDSAFIVSAEDKPPGTAWMCIVVF